MRPILISLFINLFIIHSCQFEKTAEYYTGDFETVLAIASAKNKPIWMILGGGEHCQACNQLIEDMKKENIFREYQNDYVFFRCNVEQPENTFLKYIFIMEAIPNSYIMSPKGEMTSFYAGQLQAKEIRQLLQSAKAGHPLLPPKHSQFKSDPEKLLQAQNLLLAAYAAYGKTGKDSVKLKAILPMIQKSIELEPYFYNLYLSAKVYQELHDSVRTECYAKQALQICPDGFQTIIYRPLISELQQLVSDDHSSPSFARITFEKQQLQLQDGVEGEYVFRFQNTGNQPLLVKHVSSSCSCAKPTWSQHPVLPGEKGEIKIHYHPDKNKAFSKTCWVVSNAINKVEQLTLQGNR